MVKLSRHGCNCLFDLDLWCGELYRSLQALLGMALGFSNSLRQKSKNADPIEYVSAGSPFINPFLSGRRSLGISEKIRMVVMLTLGYPAEALAARPRKKHMRLDRYGLLTRRALGAIAKGVFDCSCALAIRTLSHWTFLRRLI